MKKYRYILFDWDGCLAKTLDIWLEAYKEVFAKFGSYPTEKQITYEIFGSWTAPKNFGIDDLELFAKEMKARVEKLYTTVALYPEVKETLQSLQQRNKKIALVTTSKSDIIIPALEHHDVKKYFNAILTAEDVTNHKPDPEIVEKSIALLGGNKELSIIIGDSKSDLGAAQNAGIDSILYYPKHNESFYELSILQSYNPTYTVKELKEVLEIIQ